MVSGCSSVCQSICLSICLLIHLSIFSFPNGNLSNYPWIFIKLGMCVIIVEIWFGITNGQILSVFDSYLSTTQ